MNDPMMAQNKPGALTLPPASGEEGAIDKVKYDPMAPIGSAGSMKQLLERNSQAIASLLPKHVTVERLIRTMLVATNRNPDLLKCTQASLVESIMRAAELGLDLSGTMGEAYLVPFRNKIKYKDSKGNEREAVVDQAQMLPGYRGLAKLARQSGEVKRIAGAVVYEKDLFEYEEGVDFKLRHVPAFTEPNRGKPILVWSLIELKDGGFQALVMTVADVEKIRNNSKSPNSPAWKNWWEEMAKKTAFRRNSKMAPMSNEKFRLAIEADDAEFNLDALTTAEQQQPNAIAGGRTEALAARLTGQEAQALAAGAIDAASSPSVASVGDVLGAAEDDSTGQASGDQNGGEQEHEPGADEGEEKPRPRLSLQQCTGLRDALKKAPAIAEADVARTMDQRPGDQAGIRGPNGAESLGAVEGEPGESQADLHTRVMTVVQAMKVKPKNGNGGPQ